jgi:hypothetical protein
VIVYDYVLFDNNRINIDSKSYDAIFGKHEFYIPEIEQKFIYSVRGKIVSYGKCKFRDQMIENGTLFNGVQWEEVYLESIVNEYSLLKFLGDMKMAPPVGDMIFIKSAFSSIYEYAVLDKVGIFGYEMKDANNLSKGGWSVQVVNEMIEQGLINASPGAKNDLTNKDRKNLINGYCVDVRRSFRFDLPFYNNYKFNGETAKIWGEIRSVLNG